MYVVAVTGGREYEDQDELYEILDGLHDAKNIDLLVHGGQVGADSIAEAWGEQQGLIVARFKVTKEAWRRLGRVAGPLRTRMMLGMTTPALLVAVEGGVGTARAVKTAKELGIKVADYR